LYNAFKLGNKGWKRVDYKNPDDYIPDKARIKNTFPLHIDLVCEIWTGEDY
jgi:hypothetical protein